jgi:hypothetical protein
MSKDYEFARETLQKEYLAVSDAVRALLASSDGILIGSLTLLGALTAVAVSYKAYNVLIAVPFLVACFILFALRKTSELLAMGGYREAIEMTLARLTGGETVIWESKLRDEVVGVGGAALWTGGAAVRALHVFYALAYGASWVPAFVIASKLRRDTLALALLAIGFVLVTGLLLLAGDAARRKYSLVASRADAILKDAWPENGA